LVVVNVNSLPHNVCASIAVVLAAERRTLPVLNVCHNGYWEHGEGARAALLANCHRRDLFAVVRAVSPWHSPRWYHAAPTRAGARRIPVAPGRPTPAGIVGNAAADCLLRCGEPGVTRAAVMSLEAACPRLLLSPSTGSVAPASSILTTSSRAARDLSSPSCRYGSPVANGSTARSWWCTG
jgi:hypothetical protein